LKEFNKSQSFCQHQHPHPQIIILILSSLSSKSNEEKMKKFTLIFSRKHISLQIGYFMLEVLKRNHHILI
jgi:hypothetical protein